MARPSAVLVLVVTVSLLAWSGTEAAAPPEAARIATTVAREIQERLAFIVTVAETSAATVPTRNSDPARLRAFLAERARYVTHVLHCAYLSSDGVVKAIGPGYRFLEGTNLADQPWVKPVLQSRQTTVSQAFLSLEGLYAVAVVAPVVRGGKLQGLISILLRPTALVADQVDEARKEAPVDVWVMEAGGRLLYDRDPEEVGKSLLGDSLYRPFGGLVEAGRRIAAAEEGSTTYAFTPVDTGTPMELTAVWRSASAAGAAWRVVVTSAGDAPGAERTLARLGLPSAQEALRRLAADPAVAATALRGDWSSLRDAMARHYTRYPCYVVQWVEPSGFVPGGYPPGNALTGYQLNPFENPFDTVLQEKVQARREATFGAPLAEGQRAVFHLVPVHSGEKLVGFLYTVRVK